MQPIDCLFYFFELRPLFENLFIVFFIFLPVIEVASGEYGDILPQLVKGWKIQEKREELKRMESGDFGLNDNSDALLAQQTMMSMLPSCGFRSSTDSLSSTTSQTTQAKF